MYIGEAFVSRGPNAAHINVFIGSKDGPVGTAVASSVAAPRTGVKRRLDLQSSG